MYSLSFVCSSVNRSCETSVQSHRRRRTSEFLKHRAILWGVMGLVCLRHTIAFADIGGR